MRRMSMLTAALLLMASLRAQDASKVIFVSAKQLHADIHKAPERAPHISLIDLVATPHYSAIVVRRTAPDRAELHQGMTDLWYVTEGGGTLVTGGSLTEATQSEPGELRGAGISQGEERHVAKGDFISIPTGVPHWLSKIDSEIVYLVVKVPAPK
jgi:mannose-6-phosphate isomerase-like protein (cupin superfamily)